jgi:hypothetical protein
VLLRTPASAGEPTRLPRYSVEALARQPPQDGAGRRQVTPHVPDLAELDDLRRPNITVPPKTEANMG